MSIKEARQGKGWTQVELSDLTGVPQVRISQIERGEVDATPDQKVVLSRVLGASIAELFGGVS